MGILKNKIRRAPIFQYGYRKTRRTLCSPKLKKLKKFDFIFFHTEYVPSLEECIAEVSASTDEGLRRYWWKRDG